MASVDITVRAGKDGELLCFTIEEENFRPDGVQDLLARAYNRAVRQVHAWEGDHNATE